MSRARGFKRIVTLVLTALLAFGALVAIAPAQPASAAPVNVPLGVNLEGIGGRGLEFVNAMKSARPFEAIGGGSVSLDANGWPTADAQVVVFDERPVAAWLGESQIDDPAHYQIDVSGTYKMSFTGHAVIGIGEGDGVTVTNQAYNAATNTTTADVTLAQGNALLFLTFSQTSGGIKNLVINRPGYPLGTSQIFTTPFLNALEPFGTIRFMDWLETNNTNPYYGDPDHTWDWSERRLSGDAPRSDRHGVAWEDIIALANETQKDIWINIPIAATDDYVVQLANLLNNNLNSTSKIYVEYSNEVWNWGFTQATYNQSAAEDEVNQGGSVLNNDGSTDQYLWGRRRVAEKIVDYSQIFQNVFGSSSINARIRPILAWQVVQPPQYEELLQWIDDTFGSPSSLIYGIAGAPYFNDSQASATASVGDILDAMSADSDNSRTYRQQLQNVADSWGLKNISYEGGPDNGGGSTTNVANRILANRDSRMGDLVYDDLVHNWYELGGDLFNYFTLSSGFNRYGSWGATEDITSLNGPKYQALLDVIDWLNNGGGSTPPSGGVVNKVRYFPRAGNESRMFGGKIYGSNTSPTSGFVLLATIGSTPAAGQWTELSFNNTTAYRYLKYESPDGGWGNVAEIEFYNDNTKLTGAGFGSPGSWNNTGNGYEKALDGNTSTAFDAATADGAYVGIDIGGGSTPPSGGVVNKVRYFPRTGNESRMFGGKIYGSNTSPTSGYVLLATIGSTPAAGQWTELSFNNTTAYRYLKYESPDGGWGNVAEIEFYSDNTKLTGAGFGSPGSWNNTGNGYEKALDGNTSTAFDAATADGAYVGIDTGS